MSTKFYRDDSNKYVGGFGDGAVPPAGAIEVPDAPTFADDIWVGNKWEQDPVKKADREKKIKKKESDAAMQPALARLILGQPMTNQDTKAAQDYLDSI